jgi:hypothetical protein
MPNKDELIAKILEYEWKMFQAVPNIGGGKAPCQEDYTTFKINRISQAINWSESTLESYLDDLIAATQKERNLLTEKYGRMMESTSPREYAEIKHLLPATGTEIQKIADEIISIMLGWEEEIKNIYPNISRRSRPIHSSEDSSYSTSVETYLRGELLTYSLKTLRLYLESVKKQKAEKINGAEVTLEHMMKQYGFKSLKEADERLIFRA